MELKSARETDTVIIAYRSNRTFMELKFAMIELRDVILSF